MAASAHTICEFFTLFGDVWWHNLFCFQLVRTGKRRKKFGGKYIWHEPGFALKTLFLYF